MGMRNDGQKSGDRALVARSSRINTGLIPHSFKTLSRIVSSGASSVASTMRSAASAASAVMERDVETHHDQVLWAGFDKLELEKGVTRQVLLLGFSHGFQVWDVEAADKVCKLATRQDCAVSFMQMQPAPLTSARSEDKFADSRPLLIICADVSVSEDTHRPQEGIVAPYNGSVRPYNLSINGSHVPTVVWFYSLKSQSYIHILRFRSAVHLVRSSSRIVCVLQSTQIHCLNAATLEREYTILTNTVTPGCYGPLNMGLGPLAVGPRWMAYSGSLVAMTNSGRVNPQHPTSSCSFPSSMSNGSLVAHYAKETSKQIAAGIATLGDMGCKKFLRYCSGLLPDGKDVLSGTSVTKINGVSSGHPADADNVGMVIVRDIINKSVVAQFKAHSSPISALCFDPSGMLLVTASVKGHNINVFRIMPGLSNSTGTSGPSHIHLYSLQRGFTDAVIQDISFSSDSQWIMVSTSRGTSHLFAICPSGGMASFQFADDSLDCRGSGPCTVGKPAIHRPSNSGLQLLTPQNLCESSSPITLPAVSRIRNGSDGWISSVSSAAAATAGRLNSFSGAIASVFHKCKGNELQNDINSLKRNYYLLVFSTPGCLMQYVLHFASCDGKMISPGVNIDNEPSLSCDGKSMVEALQKWNIFQKQTRKDQGVGNLDMYEEDGICVNGRVYSSSKENENHSSSNFDLTSEEKIITEEKYNMHISEAELQMHQNTNPLWLRSEVYFQLLLTSGSDEDEEAYSGGELEIEKFPIRTLEARSKELIPVYNCLHTSKFQQGRVPVTHSKLNEQFQPNRLGFISGINKLSQGCSSSSSVSSTSNGCLNGALDNSTDENWPSLGSHVNSTKDTPVMQTVNTRGDAGMDSPLTTVHNIRSTDIKNKLGEDDDFH